jgi:lipoate-protein ligase B
VISLPGLTDYGEALELQRDLARRRIEGQLADDMLILLEHPRVITLGRGAEDSNVTASSQTLEQQGVQVFEIERGGDVTYHGPGQLVGYPIIDLDRHRRDLHWYLRQLEQVLIDVLAVYGISGRRVPGFTGVWVDNRKIASIGVHVTRWVTYHGFALNVNTRLSDFGLIGPCGIETVDMTSIEREVGRAQAIADVGWHVAESFGQVFDLDLQRAELEQLI